MGVISILPSLAGDRPDLPADCPHVHRRDASSEGPAGSWRPCWSWGRSWPWWPQTVAGVQPGDLATVRQLTGVSSQLDIEQFSRAQIARDKARRLRNDTESLLKEQLGPDQSQSLLQRVCQELQNINIQQGDFCNWKRISSSPFMEIGLCCKGICNNQIQI